jgi:hypothetical protein
MPLRWPGHAIVVCLLCSGGVQVYAQKAPPTFRLPTWAPPPWDKLTLEEQRALLAPPVYWFGAQVNRAALETDPALWGRAILVDWHTAGGMGSSENTFYLVYPSQDGPPVVAWQGLSEAHAYDNHGRLLDRVRACLYLLGDSAFAYVPLRDPTPPLEHIWDSVPAPGIYHLGGHTNLTEPQVYRTGPLPAAIGSRCRAELDTGSHQGP